jgi:hypothetical protein
MGFIIFYRGQDSINGKGKDTDGLGGKVVIHHFIKI